MKIRERNEEERQNKEELRLQREYEEQQRAEMNAAMREQTKNNIVSQNQRLLMKQAEEANKLKEQRQNNEKII
jgi:hypothetical protein